MTTTTQEGTTTMRNTRSNPTANLHAFTYRQTLPDGTERQIRRSTRLYAYSVVARLGRLPETYNAGTHPAEGTWQVVGDHSTMALAQARLAQEVKGGFVDPAGEPRVWTPTHSERPRTDRTYTELRIIGFDNARPTCAICGVPVARQGRHQDGPLVHDDNGATAYDHTAEMALEEPDEAAETAAVEALGAEIADQGGIADPAPSVADAAKVVRSNGEAEHGPVDEAMADEAQIIRLEHQLEDARQDLEVEHAKAAAELERVEHLVAERDRLAGQLDEERRAFRVSAGRAQRLDAEVRRYLHRLELVTLERDQLRERVGQMATAYEETATERRERLEAAEAELAEVTRDRDTYLELWQQSKAECGGLLDRLEALEAANPPRPDRSEVADFADERDRIIAANADDRMAAEGPAWVPVLTGRIPTAGGMGAVRVHDPDDPIARAFFTDDPDQHRAAAAAMVDDARKRASADDHPSGQVDPDIAEASAARRARALEAQAAHDREVAEHAETDAAESSWHHEMIDEVPPGE